MLPHNHQRYTLTGTWIFKHRGGIDANEVFVSSRYDPLISLKTVDEKLLSMELGRKLLIAKSEYKNKNYSRVISELGNVIESKQSSMTRQEIYDVLSLLTKVNLLGADLYRDCSYLHYLISRIRR